jgi:hypothetical protein
VDPKHGVKLLKPDGSGVTDGVFSLDGLLMHYASHHHVLEKLMMYESELQAVKYR